ncbi:hypothetical protein [Aeoliella mucimassa]|nr:hypothetical protein [Aeoliella mucimassa]
MKTYSVSAVWLVYLIGSVWFHSSATIWSQTLIEVPPDLAPSSIGSDTTLRVGTGGVLGEDFLAGTTDDSDNISASISGGVVGSGLQLAPTDQSGGSVTFSVTGGSLASLTANTGSQGIISGGSVRDLFVPGGQVEVADMSLRSIEVGGSGGQAVLHQVDSQYATVKGGAASSQLELDGGTIDLMFVDTGEQTSGTANPGEANATIHAGTVIQANVGTSSGGRLVIEGGEVLNARVGGSLDSRLLQHSGNVTLLQLRDDGVLTMTGGQLQSARTAGDRTTIHWLGGEIDSLDLSSGTDHAVHLYGTAFSLNSFDITEYLTPGLAATMPTGVSITATLMDGQTYTLPSEANIASETTVTLLLPGDYDRNGTVNLDDYQVWKQQFGSEGDALQFAADGNFDGVVSLADYTVWRDHLGTSIEASDALSVSAVPEPATSTTLSVILLLTTGCGYATRRTASQP